MTIEQKIRTLKAELEESGSEQYKTEIRRQIERLEYYLMHGHWPLRQLDCTDEQRAEILDCLGVELEATSDDLAAVRESLAERILSGVSEDFDYDHFWYLVEHGTPQADGGPEDEKAREMLAAIQRNS